MNNKQISGPSSIYQVITNNSEIILVSDYHNQEKYICKGKSYDIIDVFDFLYQRVENIHFIFEASNEMYKIIKNNIPISYMGKTLKHFHKFNLQRIYLTNNFRENNNVDKITRKYYEIKNNIYEIYNKKDLISLINKFKDIIDKAVNYKFKYIKQPFLKKEYNIWIKKVNEELKKEYDFEDIGVIDYFKTRIKFLLSDHYNLILYDKIFELKKNNVKKIVVYAGELHTSKLYEKLIELSKNNIYLKNKDKINSNNDNFIKNLQSSIKNKGEFQCVALPNNFRFFEIDITKVIKGERILRKGGRKSRKKIKMTKKEIEDMKKWF